MRLVYAHFPINANIINGGKAGELPFFQNPRSLAARNLKGFWHAESGGSGCGAQGSFLQDPEALQGKAPKNPKTRSQAWRPSRSKRPSPGPTGPTGPGPLKPAGFWAHDRAQVSESKGLVGRCNATAAVQKTFKCGDEGEQIKGSAAEEEGHRK